MKTIQLLIITGLITGSLHAEFRTWTRNDGNKAKLELVGKSGEGADARASFKMENGKVVEIPVSGLIEADVKLISEWESETTAAADPGVSMATSVFDDILEKNLVKLDGKSLKRYELEKKPTKYYVFYYTASWCGPCQQFTPSLVEFYNKHKEGNDNFELVLITSDSSDDDMEGYAKGKKMPWPHLKLSKADDFKKKFNHGVTGIPSVIVCDLDGKIVSSEGRNLAELEKIIK